MFVITSSQGTWHAHSESGDIINGGNFFAYPTGAIDTKGTDKSIYIQRIDIAEYKKNYNISQMPDYVDILDIGYWYRRNGAPSHMALDYECPCEDWRMEMQLAG